MPSYVFNSPKSNEIVIKKGRYFFEAWGAQGGCSNESSGRGGYASGYIQFNKPTKIFVFVGGKGVYSDSDPSAGFNGGGKGFIGYHKPKSGGGGGSTDFRFDKTDLKSRFLIAGGGGGEGTYITTTYNGGAGGGTNGTDGACLNGHTFNGKAGNQTAGGAAVNYNGHKSGEGTELSGGIGTGSAYSGGGGGGGYYSGSGGYESGGGGGSGYASASVMNPKLINGNTKMPHINNVVSEGNKGDGAARITILDMYWQTKGVVPKNFFILLILNLISK